MEQSWQTFLSLVKIILKSKFDTRTPPLPCTGKELVILANGPSLNTTVREHAPFLEGKTLLAVNFSVVSDLFTELKPQLYLLADPLFWIVPENRQRVFGALAEKTAWPLVLFMPVRAYKDKNWQETLRKNPYITVVKYNTTPVEGYRWFCHRVYRCGLGVPRPHNVLIPSIAVSLRMPFEKIYLTGADHSWLPEITVTDENEVWMHQKHFYDQKTSQARTVKKEDLKPASLSTILYHMSVAFKSYFILRDFATFLHKEVINVTPGSYIDAFRREKLPSPLPPQNLPAQDASKKNDDQCP